VYPQPDTSTLQSYYDKEYFLQRTERGYDNYFSNTVKEEVERIFRLNLKDISFYCWEKDYLRNNKNLNSLDIGCAAGYFVAYMKERGYDAHGVEISEDIAKYGREKLKLNIKITDFLNLEFDTKFDLITSWASLEHMPDPVSFFRRINSILKPGGLLIISTCCYGNLARLYGLNWRYLNVPEHLFFFSKKSLINLGEKFGLKVWKKISYGSGFTTKPQAGFFYKFTKICADKLVKIMSEGDMIVISFTKKFFTQM